MKRFKKILFISRCHEQYQNSLYHAIKLSHSNKAEIKFFLLTKVLPKELKNYQQKIKISYISNFEQSIENACKEIKISKSDLKMSISMNFSNLPDVQVVQQVIKDDHDLIIKSIDEVEHGFKSVDMNLLRNVPCPLWFFRSSSRNKTIKKIAAAVDATRTDELNINLSEKIVTIANNLAKTYNSSLDIVTCWSSSMPDSSVNNLLIDLSEQEIASVQQKEMNNINQNIKKIISNSSIDATSDFNIHNLNGTPEDLIPKFILDNDIEILVMGTVARTGISGFFIGNTAENVLHKITCSLLALKPEGFKSPVECDGELNEK